MNCLLDTHAFLWAVMDTKKLSATVRAALADSANTVAVSAVSFWEIALKSALGKLVLNGVTSAELPGFAVDMGLEVLPLKADVAASFSRLPRLQHRDPFDRMLIWQAICEKHVLVSRDKDLSAYHNLGLKQLW